jgi:multidrug efflux pump subunit AcrB
LLTFLSIPLILIGIPYGLLLTGQPLSFFGTLGIISLAGIIINNAIVLIDQIDIERATLGLRAAIVAASQKRLRPILLTSATTILGLAPMAVMGGALWKPMAVLMMSGLVLASLLTLFFVPAGYFLLFRFSGSSATAIGEQEQVGSASGGATINAASRNRRRRYPAGSGAVDT